MNFIYFVSVVVFELRDSKRFTVTLLLLILLQLFCICEISCKRTGDVTMV